MTHIRTYIHVYSIASPVDNIHICSGTSKYFKHTLGDQLFWLLYIEVTQ